MFAPTLLFFGGFENSYWYNTVNLDAQDGFDLFTGSWKPRPGATANAALWLDNRPLIARSVSCRLFSYSTLLILLYDCV